MDQPTSTQESLDYVTRVEHAIHWSQAGSKTSPARFWQYLGLDSLILHAPEHSGKPQEVAREVYHRLVARFISTETCRLQERIKFISMAVYVVGSATASLGAASNGFGGFLGILPDLKWLPILFYIATPITLFVIAGYTWENAPHMMCSSSRLKQFHDEAKGAVQRCFLRTMPKLTAGDPAPIPDDLADVWRHGWLTSEGRPVSSEIVETDATSLVAIETAQGWRSLCLYVLMLGLLSLAAPCVVCFGPLLVLFGLRGRMNPGELRAMELNRRQGVEGALLVTAGGIEWAEHQEQARIEQLMEARSDVTPIFHLGTATGILAGRGDFYAPSSGLPFDLSLRDLQNHVLVLGGTGSGKTSCVLRPLAHQIAAHKKIGLVVMDGKAALPGELRELSEMQIIDPATSRFSLVAGLTPAELVNTIADVLRSGKETDPYWSESAIGLMRRAAVIAKHAGGTWWTLQGIMRIAATDEGFKEANEQFPIERILEDPMLEEALLYFGHEWRNLDPKPKTSILSQARSWITTITAHPDLLRWAETPAGQDSFDLLAPLKGGRIGFLIPGHRYGRAGAAVTAILKARLYAALKARAERSPAEGETPVVFIIDEVQEVATGEDATMLSIGRSLGLSMVGATQTVEGVTEKLGEAGAAKWLAVYGNAIAFAGRSKATNAFVAERAGSAWKASVETVPGISVKDCITASVFSGAVAASRKQATMRQFASPPPSPVAPFMQQAQTARVLSQGKNQISPDPRMNREGDTGVSSGLKPVALVFAEEMATLLAEPNLALAVTTRARVPRRDVIKLTPIF